MHTWSAIKNIDNLDNFRALHNVTHIYIIMVFPPPREQDSIS